MTENVRKLVGVVVIAALVVVGVAVSSGSGVDVDFTRNAAFTKLPAAQRARLAPAFAPQPAPKTNKASGQIKAGIVLQAPGQTKAGIVLQSGGTNALWTGKASVLAGKGVDGKGGTTSFRAGGGMNGKTGKAGIFSTTGAHALSGRKASFRAGAGMDGVADRIEKCGYVTSAGNDEIATVKSLKNVLVSSYRAPADKATAGLCDVSEVVKEGEAPKVFPKVEIHVAELLATCMESKVGAVFLKSHIKSSADDCIATVMPALSPDRAKRLGTYWQTQQQLICVPPGCTE